MPLERVKMTEEEREAWTQKLREDRIKEQRYQQHKETVRRIRQAAAKKEKQKIKVKDDVERRKHRSDKRKAQKARKRAREAELDSLQPDVTWTIQTHVSAQQLQDLDLQDANSADGITMATTFRQNQHVPREQTDDEKMRRYKEIQATPEATVVIERPEHRAALSNPSTFTSVTVADYARDGEQSSEPLDPSNIDEALLGTLPVVRNSTSHSGLLGNESNQKTRQWCNRCDDTHRGTCPLLRESKKQLKKNGRSQKA